MREFKIRSAPTILTTLKEPPKKNNKKKIKWQRISFLFVILVLLTYVGAKVYMQLAVIQADAQVELHKQLIHFPSDVLIAKIYIEEGQQINKGDTLFKYTIPLDNHVTTSEINIDKPIEWIQRERINTKKNIALTGIDLREKRKQLSLRREMHETKKSLILIGSHQDRNEYDALSIQINKLASEEKSLLDEITYLNTFLNSLRLEHSNYKRIETRKKDFIETKYHYVAKLDGIVGQINYNENEICYRKEELMTIHKVNELRVKAFFEPEDMKYLAEGDVVNINYPDQSKTQGIITNFHIATYALPEEFQKKYEPTTRNIVAEIQLLDHTHMPLMSYYKMNVLVSKNRYNFKAL